MPHVAASFVVALASLQTPPADPAKPPAPAAPVLFAKPRLLTSWFADAPRWPLVADLDGDGFGDLVAIDPNAGIVDVARSVRGGKFLGPVNAANGLGVVVAATTRMGEKNRVALVLELKDAARKVVTFGDDSQWHVADETNPAAPTAPATTGAPAPTTAATPAAIAHFDVAPTTDDSIAHSRDAAARRLVADFDGDGAADLLDGAKLTLAADPSHPQDVALFASVASLAPNAVVVAGDVTGDRRADLVLFRRDDAWRTGRDVLVCPVYRDGDADADGDGLDAATEARWKSDPLDGDTDHDGLLDGWEVKGESAIDLPALGASPSHQDCFVYVQRYSDTDGHGCSHEVDRVVKTWSEMPNQNPDGTTGIALHPIWLPPLPPGTPGRAWWDLGNENLPKSARGLAHYMEIYNGGAGQAGELAEMGGCGSAALWACFLHEFGHEVGLAHNGGPGGGGPTYTSLMNYNYSYGFNDDGNQIHYSRGDLAKLVLNETHLSERVPFPIDQLRFLEKGPYHFKLKADGDATLVDWNRNGQFDEGIVRADVDDVYGVGTRRFGCGKTVFAPTLFEHAGRLFLIGANRDKRLYTREIHDHEKFEPESWIDTVKPTGDPAVCDDGSQVILCVPTDDGIVVLDAAEPEQLGAAKPELLPDTKGLSVSAAIFQERPLVFLWKDETTPVTFTTHDGSGSFTVAKPLLEKCTTAAGVAPFTSNIPIAACEDPVTHELVVGFGTKRGEKGKEHNAWRLLRLRADAAAGASGAAAADAAKAPLVVHAFTEVSQRPVGDENCGWYGNARPMLLIEHTDESHKAAAEGRIHFVGRGFAGPPHFNCCTYEAITIGDATQNDGWRLRRYCDEWSTTRSPIGAALHGDDMVVAYRWFGNVHGDEDDDVHVLWNAFGIFDQEMHDFDDVAEISQIGLQRSILWRDPAAK